MSSSGKRGRATSATSSALSGSISISISVPMTELCSMPIAIASPNVRAVIIASPSTPNVPSVCRQPTSIPILLRGMARNARLMMTLAWR